MLENMQMGDRKALEGYGGAAERAHYNQVVFVRGVKPEVRERRDGDGEVRGSSPSNDIEQEENIRELGKRSCKRQRTVESDHDQKVGSREAERVMKGAGGPRGSRSKSASPLSRLFRGFCDSNTRRSLLRGISTSSIERMASQGRIAFHNIHTHSHTPI